MCDQTAHPVGVFDSGCGGISVLRELVKTLPGEDFLYYGDNAYAPYGCKSKAEVQARAFAVTQTLTERGVKALVIACNTATSAAAEELRKSYPDLIIVGMEPAIKPAALSAPHPRVLIMATEMTLGLEKFRVLEEKLEDEADFELLPCPRLVTLVEEGKAESKECEAYLREALGRFLDDPPDCVVLGCTHFPFARAAINRLFCGKSAIFDGSAGTARQLRRRLDEAGLLRGDRRKGSVVFENSDDRPEVLERMKALFDAKEDGE